MEEHFPAVVVLVLSLPFEISSLTVLVSPDVNEPMDSGEVLLNFDAAPQVFSDTCSNMVGISCCCFDFLGDSH